MKFHLIKLGSRPLLAVPCGKHSLWGVAIDCYPAHTGKKRLVRKLLHGLAGVGLIRWAFPARNLSLPGVEALDFEAWVALLCEQLHVAELQPVLVWPADPLRGRVYMYLLNKKGEKVGFCKLGLDARNNALIERERQALEHLQSMELKLSRIPKLLAHGNLDGEMVGGNYLVVEITPANTRNIDWQSDASIEANIAEYAGSGRIIDRAEIESLSWWPGVTRRFANHSVLMDEINAALDQGIEVCLAHGDLNCTNVLLSKPNDQVWLLDWEQSDASAPMLTDQVCMAVDKLWLANAQDASGTLKKFKDTFTYENDAKKRAQIIMALAYLSAAGFPPALAMIDAIYAEGS
jgi:hypothetical protein